MKMTNLHLRLLFYFSFAHYTTCLCTDSVLEEDTRIVGGTTTTRSEWPSILNLQTKTRGLYCGGNFLGNYFRKDGSVRSFVLTAAHCCDPMLKNITVSTFHPDSDEYKTLPQGVVWQSQVTRKHVHPKYDVASGSFDFCLLELNKMLTIKKGFLEPALLVSEKFSVTGQHLQGVAVGWGVINENGQIPSKVLRKVTVPIIGSLACNATYESQGITITPDMICAGTEGRDACMSDSGGPLYTKLDDVYLVTGIISFGIGCGRPLPGIYAFVSFARPWIDKSLKS